MATLIIDAGNTSVKMVRWTGGFNFPDFSTNSFTPGRATDSPEELGSVPTELFFKNPAEFADQISALGKETPDQVVLVSVIPGIEILLRNIWDEINIVGLNGSLPFAHEIREPQTVGSDRFCNIACAVAAGLNSALVVDVGTATTFDLLLDGVFKGGLIAPGMAFASQLIGSRGAMLEPVPFEVRPPEVGQNTREAMMGGAWLTGRGGVEWTISRLLETYGRMPVVLTGGLAELLPLENRYLDRHWTLRGAGFLAVSDENKYPQTQEPAHG